MAEATAKTGVYDIFNDFPYTMPDAAGAGVVVPLDEYAARGQPDFSGVAPGLRFQQYYQGKLYNMVLDGDHIILVIRKDLVENPMVQEEYRAKFGKDPGCPETHDRMGGDGRVLPHRGRRDAVGDDVRAAALRGDGLSGDQLLLPALSRLSRRAPVSTGT